MALALGFFSRLFKRTPKPRNVVAPLDEASGKYVLTETVRVKWRPANDLPEQLRDELVRVCHKNPCVDTCYLLDVIEQPTQEVQLWISLALDEPSHLDQVAAQMQQVFRRFPNYTNRFFIGVDLLAEVPPEHATYRRTTVAD